MPIDWKIRPGTEKTLEEQYVETAKTLDNICLRMSKRIKELESDKTILQDAATRREATIQMYKLKESDNNLFLSSITPVKCYHHKTRGNTTVKFLDGSSVTVHRMKGDKDDLETAIAYALVKKIFPKQIFKKLVEETEITEVKK